jgi:hypothetical protein
VVGHWFRFDAGSRGPDGIDRIPLDPGIAYMGNIRPGPAAMPSRAAV